VKIFNFAKKELDLLTSQKMSLALVIAYPLLIVLVIVLAFGSQGAQPTSGFERADVAYYLPFESENFDSVDFLDDLAKVERLRLHRASSVEDVKEAINQGIAKVGIVVHEPVSKFDKTRVSFYYDNSSPLVSKMVMSYANFSITLYANKKSTQVLTDIWNNIADVEKSLEGQYTKIEGFEKGLDDARQRITSFEAKINSIDTASLKNKLSQFDPQYIDSKNKIASAQADVLDAKGKLVSYRQKLVNTRNELALYSDTLKSIRSDLQNVRASSPEPIYSQIGNIESELSQTIAKIDESIAEIDSAIAEIDQSQQKLDKAYSDLGSAGNALDQARQSVEEFKLAVDNLENTLAELKVLIQDSYTYYDQTKQNLSETKLLITDLTNTLEEFMKYKPEQLVRPFIIEEKKMYLEGEEYMDIERTAILIPVSLTIVLLLTCVLFAAISILTERKQGINIRVHASPTSKLTWMAGKIAGQITFALLESAIILGIAVFVFGVPLIGSVLDLFIALVVVSFTFISLGMFLTNFTSEQSTAILSSLIIMIPFLFMSGLIFPIEFMPFYMQGIANILPLTVGSGLLMNTIVKGIPLIFSIDKVIVLVVPGIILVAFTAFNKKI